LTRARRKGQTGLKEGRPNPLPVRAKKKKKKKKVKRDAGVDQMKRKRRLKKMIFISGGKFEGEAGEGPLRELHHERLPSGKVGGGCRGKRSSQKVASKKKGVRAKGEKMVAKRRGEKNTTNGEDSLI